MAVTFDSRFYNGSGGAGATSPFSFVSNAGTVTGSVGANSNRILIGHFSIYNNNAAGTGTVSMTWAGVTMTPIGSLVDMPAGPGCLQLFGLIAPATGAQTLSVSWTGTGPTVDIDLGAVSLFNADQSTGWTNATSATGTGPTTPSGATLTVTTTNGDMAVVGHQNNNASSTTIGTGTSAWIDTANNGNAAQGYNAAVGVSTIVAWTLGSSQAWANVGVSVKQVSASDTLMAQISL